eukprot:GHVS01066159.1.p1 GENE.GHVS01066159.1~~GHVS01066159.1.p1  ORF type:complete len:186 (-),score=57.95 GHVS01066159.1:206-763(-)
MSTIFSSSTQDHSLPSFSSPPPPAVFSSSSSSCRRCRVMRLMSLLDGHPRRSYNGVGHLPCNGNSRQKDNDNSRRPGQMEEEIADDGGGTLPGGESVYEYAYRSLQAMAIEPGGFGSDDLRQLVWPFLLGLPLPVKAYTRQPDSWSTPDSNNNNSKKNDSSNNNNNNNNDNKSNNNRHNVNLRHF